MFYINFLAVAATAVSGFLLGGLWYSEVLFEDIWLRESGTDAQQGHAPVLFGLGPVLGLWH